MDAQRCQSFGLLGSAFDQPVVALWHGMHNQLSCSLPKSLQLLAKGGPSSCCKLGLLQWFLVPCQPIECVELKPGKAFVPNHTLSLLI